ncbi:MAG: hypothetical protein ACR2KJ_00240 [Jatrophihabitans sp.]
MTTTAARGGPGLALKSVRGRWVLLATVPGSGMAQLDGTVVNVALPRIGEDLHTGLSSLQWTLNAYTLGLAAFIYALTEGPAQGWPPALLVSAAAGVLLLAGFLVNEHRRPEPMMPLSLFRNRQFSAANLVTLVVYAALSGALFLLPVQLQLVSGFSPVAAGSALLPVTLVMLLLSARMGRVAQRIGPR